MANWVKFLRGTFEEYSALSTKEQDTLYFVYSEDGTECALYLGNRLVSGNGTIDGASNIDELIDVLITNVADKNILQYSKEKEQWINVSFESIINQIKDQLPSPTSFITAVNDAQFTVDNGTLGLKPVKVSEIEGLQAILDNKVEKEEGSRLINTQEIAALHAIMDSQFNGFECFIKSVDTDTFSVDAETGKLSLISIPAGVLTPVIGDMTTLPNYAENNNITIAEEINNLYELLTWKSIVE